MTRISLPPYWGLAGAGVVVGGAVVVVVGPTVVVRGAVVVGEPGPHDRVSRTMEVRMP
jgi:hypothetical protein